MFEDVIVQKPLARNVYSEHSFVTRRTPLRGEDDDDGSTPLWSAVIVADVDGAVGDRWPSQLMTTAEAMMAAAMRRLSRITGHLLSRGTCVTLAPQGHRGGPA
jgi:hypothetical protein